ncbi:MAG: Gldg family protein, partial [Polyangiaceae bacterium]
MSRAGLAYGTRAIDVAGIVAAIVLAAVVNVLSARHFTRWDWTTAHRWSLSPATLATLDHLEQRIDVWAVAGPGDPLEPDLRAVLLAYQAASSRVNVQWIDPDRDTVQLVDLRRRFGIQAGVAVDGRVATDAIVVVGSGEKHWFLTPSDLFDQTSDARARPREERALTRAIRAVLGGDRPKLCFTVGHGELSIDAGKGEHEDLGALRDLLEKNNYDLASVDASGPDQGEPFAGCTGVVLAGPRSPFSPAEVTRIRAWLLSGGSLFAAVGPMDADTPTGMIPAGLDDVLGPFGIGLDDVLVHDADPGRAIPDTHGEGFFVTAKPHPVTASLVGGSDPHPPRTAVFFTRSLH